MAHEIVDIEIDINNCEMKIECDGFSGEGCNVIEDVENIISSNVISRTDKDEKYQYQNINPATINNVN